MIISPYRVKIYIDGIENQKLGNIEKFLFRTRGKESFVVSKRYLVKIRFEALTSIPCARIKITALWPSKIRDFHEFDIGPLKIDEEASPPKKLDFGVIEPGYGLILLDGKASPRESDCNLPFIERKDLEEISFFFGDDVLEKHMDYGVHIESVFGQL